jgi:retinol-binding protein 3
MQKILDYICNNLTLKGNNRSRNLLPINPAIMLKQIPAIIFIGAILVIPNPKGLRAQQTPPQSPLTKAEKKAVIDSLCRLLDGYYIYPAVATKMIDFLSRASDRGVYDSLQEPLGFAGQLRKDLIAVSHDEHFNVIFDPAWVSSRHSALTKKDSLELISQDSLRGAATNFGFAEVRILPGNLGYLKLTQFDNPLYAGETAAAAMQFLRHTNAVIFDLRDNGGGFSTMVQLLATYLVGPEPVHLVDMYTREGGKPGADSMTYTQDWTLPFVPGQRLSGKEVYVLTNHQTFSAAESFSYFLKNTRRATIVGETTGGGAHPVDRKILSDRFYIFLPVARPVDPITGTNWEGAGVQPDVPVASKAALATAERLALEKEVAGHPGDIGLAWALDAVKAGQHPLSLSTHVMQSYTGLYEDRQITLDGGKLYYQRIAPTGQPTTEAYEMMPLKDDLFMFPEVPYLRIQFVLENGKVVGLKRLYNDGSERPARKTR